MFKLENIGFYTLSDARAGQAGPDSPLWRAEIILTDKCNFSCPYCRGIAPEHQKSLTIDQVKTYIDLLAKHNLKNIRFSGGEPTTWKGLPEIIAYAKNKKIERIALSTNGSVKTEYYDLLIQAGINDFSISLDACCSSTGDRMAGVKGAWEKVIKNIKHLSQKTYVTVGVVLTEENYQEIEEIIEFASDQLLVSDIRIVSSAQWNENFTTIKVKEEYLKKHKILNYRINNYQNGRNIRGINHQDNHKCPLVLDDLAILDDEHYPCIIYMRERGPAIGKFNDNFRQSRIDWYQKHNTKLDLICSKNCLDVCVDYNNQYKKHQKLK